MWTYDIYYIFKEKKKNLWKCHVMIFKWDLHTSARTYSSQAVYISTNKQQQTAMEINGYICEEIGIKSRKRKEKRSTESCWKSKSRFWEGGLIGQECNIPGNDFCPLQSYHSIQKYRNQYLHAGKAATKKHLKTKCIWMRTLKPAVKRSSLLLLIRKLANKSQF